MVYRKTPSYLWQNRTGLYHFKLGIPAELRKFYTDEKTGKPRTHIVVSLETHERAIAEKRKLPLLLEHKAAFERLTREGTGKPDSALMLKVERIREDRAKLAAVHHSEWTDEHEGLDIGLTIEVENTYHELKAALGEDEAERALTKMNYPDRKTVGEGLTSLIQDSSGDKTDGTISSYKMAVGELLAFMKVQDCYPESVTDAVALLYVDKLNEGTLSVSAKNTRLGALRALWKHMSKRPGWKHDPWKGHSLTKPKKATAEGENEEATEVRPFTEDEIVRLFTLEEPKDNRQRKYTRSLFRQLYALGFITGMRLNEIASLRRMDVSKLDETWRVLSVRKQVGKTAAAERQIPVCHPVALAIIDARMAEPGEPQELLFKECTPEKAGTKPGKKVGDAMSNERMQRLQFTPREVDFHSTRRNFATLLEQQTEADPIAQQRYFGHDVPSLMHRVYSGGAGVEKLKKVVTGLTYPAAVEEAIRLAIPAHAD